MAGVFQPFSALIGFSSPMLGFLRFPGPLSALFLGLVPITHPWYFRLTLLSPRFESYWLRHQAVLEVVTQAWNSSMPEADPVKLFSRKLESVQAALRLNQLGVQHVPSVNINLQALYEDEQVDLSSLHAPFTLAEVRTAMFSSAPEKASGPDGLPMIFYQRF
ncbi:hypothetical protein ACMD2_06896 [Ananas comosus]|uniref:Uncharacterized protein n=1 Tax=Ananas comosus TaxID=4615 RepID=A0A199VZK0_ANACO|nr:hypothetical protein ACMD2_06896 [Ananas comosus]